MIGESRPKDTLGRVRAGYFPARAQVFEVRERFGDGELLVFGVQLIEAVTAPTPA